MDSLHDLTPILSKFLDPHLLLPVLEFLMHKTQFAQADLEASKLRVLAATNMVDFAMDVGLKTCSTHEFPQNMQEQRERIMSTMQLLKSEGEPILSLIADQARVAELRQERCFNQPFLQQHFNISPSHVDILHKYAKFTYDCGDYRSAADLLVHFRQLSINSDKHFSALWGKLACEILRTNWEAALEDLNSLRDSIDSRTGTPPAMQLQQRCWLMHWALFMLGNHPNGRSIIVDLFFQDRYLNALQTHAPHLLRYLAVAVVTNPRRRDKVKDLVPLIAMERPVYSDPITQFLEDLHLHAKFEHAQQRLKNCAQVLDKDFFLSNLEQLFIRSARLSIFETYCRIHERIDLKMLAQNLGLEQVAAEQWVVKMVSEAQLNAKIDSESDHVVLGTQPPDVYQQVIEKTKGLCFRSYVLAQNIEKRVAPMTAAVLD